MTIQWLFEELTTSFQGYSYYHALPDQMQSRAMARPGKLPVISQVAAETEPYVVVSFKSYGSKDPMRSLLELQLIQGLRPNPETRVISQRAAETKPYAVVSYRATALRSR